MKVDVDREGNTEASRKEEKRGMDANHSRRTNLFVVSTVEELERARVAENYVFHLFKSQTRLHACLQDIGSLLSGMDGLIDRLVEGTGRTLVRNGIIRIAIGIAHHYDQNHYVRSYYCR